MRLPLRLFVVIPGLVTSLAAPLLHYEYRISRTSPYTQPQPSSKLSVVPGIPEDLILSSGADSCGVVSGRLGGMHAAARVSTSVPRCASLLRVPETQETGRLTCLDKDHAQACSAMLR